MFVSVITVLSLCLHMKFVPLGFVRKSKLSNTLLFFLVPGSPAICCFNYPGTEWTTAMENTFSSPFLSREREVGWSGGTRFSDVVLVPPQPSGNEGQTGDIHKERERLRLVLKQMGRIKCPTEVCGPSFGIPSSSPFLILYYICFLVFQFLFSDVHATFSSQIMTVSVPPPFSLCSPLSFGLLSPLSLLFFPDVPCTWHVAQKPHQQPASYYLH